MSLALIFDFTKHLFDVSWKCRAVEVQRWHARCLGVCGHRRVRHQAFARPTRRRRPRSTGQTRNFGSDGRPGLPRASALDYG